MRASALFRGFDPAALDHFAYRILGLRSHSLANFLARLRSMQKVPACLEIDEERGGSIERERQQLGCFCANFRVPSNQLTDCAGRDTKHIGQLDLRPTTLPHEPPDRLFRTFQVRPPHNRASPPSAFDQERAY